MTTSILFRIRYSVFGLALNKIHDYNIFVNSSVAMLRCLCSRCFDVLCRDVCNCDVSMFIAIVNRYVTGVKTSVKQWGVASLGGLLREVNIKSGMPIVDDAIRRITYNIKNAGALGVSAIKLIHGYGSTGKGGAIRTETHKYLERQKQRGQIKDYIKGEDFSIFNEATRKAFAACDGLRRDCDIERHNNGITIVVL